METLKILSQSVKGDFDVGDFVMIPPEAPPEPDPEIRDKDLITTTPFIIRDAQYYLEDRPPALYAVEKLFVEKSVNAIVGPPGGKKTWSMYDLAVKFALGLPWCGLKTSGGTALIIDEESGDERLARRMAAILRGLAVTNNPPIYSVSLAGFNLLKRPDDINKLYALLSQVRPRLIIIDALADVMAGGDENAVKDTQPVFLALRKAAVFFDCTINVIHHTGKNGSFRGSTAIQGAVETMVMVESAPDSPVIRFTTEKNRDGEPLIFSAHASFGEDTFNLAPVDNQAAIVKLSKSEKYVIRYLKGVNFTAYIDDIMDHADMCTSEAARRAVYSLTDKEFVFRSDEGGRGSKAEYSLTNKGQEYDDL